MFEPILESKTRNLVKYFHKDIRIVVGTFAGIDGAIVETDQGTRVQGKTSRPLLKFSKVRNFFLD